MVKPSRLEQKQAETYPVSNGTCSKSETRRISSTAQAQQLWNPSAKVVLTGSCQAQRTGRYEQYMPVFNWIFVACPRFHDPVLPLAAGGQQRAIIRHSIPQVLFVPRSRVNSYVRGGLAPMSGGSSCVLIHSSIQHSSVYPIINSLIIPFMHSFIQLLIIRSFIRPLIILSFRIWLSSTHPSIHPSTQLDSTPL